MDFSRKDKPSKKRRHIVVGLMITALIAMIALLDLKPAVPTVNRQSILLDTVKHGPMVFEVRGTGTLQPVDVRWLTANVDCRVERVLVQPGATVKANTVILEMSNPELRQAAQDAQWQFRSAEGELAGAKARIQGGILERKSAVASAKASLLNARMDLDAQEALAKDGLVARQLLLHARGKVEELDTRYMGELERFRIEEESVSAQLAPFRSKVEQARDLWNLKRSQVAGLHVRAGMDGVLQSVLVQVGQRVTLGGTLAKVAEPSRLKAELKIGETQAKDIQVGQVVTIDTRNGLVRGRVVRIDPAVVNGTVTVDATLEGTSPKGVRPDLNVDGIIELDRAGDGVFVGRPVQAQPFGTADLFRVDADGKGAQLVKIKFGRGSVSTIEIVDGLRPGDQVIISDTGSWASSDRIRIK